VVRSGNSQQLVIRLVKRSFGKQQVIQGNPHGFYSIPTKQIQIGNFGHKKTGYDLPTSPYLASAVKAPMIGNGCLLTEW